MLKRSLTAMLVLFLGSSAYASISGLGVGIHGGVVSGYSDKTLEQSIQDAYGSIVDFKLSGDMKDVGFHLNIGTFRIIEFDASLDYAWKKQTVIDNIDLTFSDFSVSATVRKSISIGILRPYAGLGIGVHRMAYSISTGTVTVLLPSNQNKFGGHFKAGLELKIPVIPLTPYAEFRYNQIQTTGKATKYSAILAGLTLDLP